MEYKINTILGTENEERNRLRRRNVVEAVTEAIKADYVLPPNYVSNLVRKKLTDYDYITLDPEDEINVANKALEIMEDTNY